MTKPNAQPPQAQERIEPEHVCGVRGMCTLDCSPPAKLVIGLWVSIPSDAGAGAQRKSARVNDVARGGEVGYVETTDGERGWYGAKTTRLVPRPRANVVQLRREIIEPRWAGVVSR